MTPQEHAAEAARMAVEAGQRPAGSPAAGTYALRGLLHAVLGAMLPLPEMPDDFDETIDGGAVPPLEHFVDTPGPLWPPCGADVSSSTVVSMTVTTLSEQVTCPGCREWLEAYR